MCKGGKVVTSKIKGMQEVENTQNCPTFGIKELNIKQ